MSLRCGSPFRSQPNSQRVHLNRSVARPPKPCHSPTRSFSSKSAEIKGYHELIKAPESEKVKKIAKSYFLENLSFSLDQAHFSSDELMELLIQVKEKRQTRFPIHEISHSAFSKKADAIHFEMNKTFIQFPYNPRVLKWSDRVALQKLIRENFLKLFEENSLAIVPGCADGQIAIEIYSNSLKNNIKSLEIVATDFNLPAMELGYVTMKSFGLNANRIKWVQADVSETPFFQWINKHYIAPLRKHQIATLVQPSLRESTFLSFLKHSSNLAKLNEVYTTLIMPVLLADPKSEWFQDCDKNVNKAFDQGRKENVPPKLIWNKTRYGIELLSLNRDKTSYVPQQYFVDPVQLPVLMAENSYKDESRLIFDSIENPNDYTQKEDPRRIPQASGSPAQASRIFCIWKVNQNKV